MAKRNINQNLTRVPDPRMLEAAPLDLDEIVDRLELVSDGLSDVSRRIERTGGGDSQLILKRREIMERVDPLLDAMLARRVELAPEAHAA